MFGWIKKWRQRRAEEDKVIRKALLPMQEELFPEGRPSPEEAIARIAQLIRERNGMDGERNEEPKA